MKTAIRKGIGFGLTSGIMTTLGLIIGLHASTHSASVVLSGILIIAIADAMSDAFGIHISEESSKKTSAEDVKKSTISTFLTKFVVALTFIVPVLLLSLNTAIIISVIWGLSLISIFSYHIAKIKGKKPYKVVLEHLIITIIVIVITHYVGVLLSGI